MSRNKSFVLVILIVLIVLVGFIVGRRSQRDDGKEATSDLILGANEVPNIETSPIFSLETVKTGDRVGSWVVSLADIRKDKKFPEFTIGQVIFSGKRTVDGSYALTEGLGSCYYFWADEAYRDSFPEVAGGQRLDSFCLPDTAKDKLDFTHGGKATITIDHLRYWVGCAACDNVGVEAELIEVLDNKPNSN